MTGLFFGSFNPVHVGHMVLASCFLEYAPIADLQLILSPQNPLKRADTLASERHRLKMLELALAAYPELPISINTIEFELPKPSYTIDTLTVLQQQNPDVSYMVLMGADSLASIKGWRDYQKILSGFRICVYPRIGYDLQALCNRYNVSTVSAPIIEISSTAIRAAIGEGRGVSTYLPYGVWSYIEEHKLY